MTTAITTRQRPPGRTVTTEGLARPNGEAGSAAYGDEHESTAVFVINTAKHLRREEEASMVGGPNTTVRITATQKKEDAGLYTRITCLLVTTTTVAIVAKTTTVMTARVPGTVQHAKEAKKRRNSHILKLAPTSTSPTARRVKPVCDERGLPLDPAVVTLLLFPVARSTAMMIGCCGWTVLPLPNRDMITTVRHSTPLRKPLLPRQMETVVSTTNKTLTVHQKPSNDSSSGSVRCPVKSARRVKVLSQKTLGLSVVIY